MKTLLAINIAVAIFLTLNRILYLIWPESLVVTLSEVMWELSIIPIIGFILFCIVFLLVKLYKKDSSRYIPVFFLLVLNIFLLIILPYLIG